jgi:hypothetical protein
MKRGILARASVWYSAAVVCGQRPAVVFLGSSRTNGVAISEYYICPIAGAGELIRLPPTAPTTVSVDPGFVTLNAVKGLCLV